MINFAAALKFWLVFLLCFWLAGFSAIQSIFLGALAGWTGGLLSKWWSIKTVVDDDSSDSALLKPAKALSRFFDDGERRGPKGKRYSRKPKTSMGWYGPLGPPKGPKKRR